MDTAKFNGCVTNVRDLNESGTSEADIMEKAMKLYRTRHGNDRKNYSYLHCWMIVKDFPRFFEAGRPESSKVLGKRRSSAQDMPVPSPMFPSISTSDGQTLPSIPVPSNPSSSKGKFHEMPMGSKQAKNAKADENTRTYTLRQTAEAALSLSSDVAERNKLLAQQIQCTADQTAITLFKEAGNRNPSLVDKYFLLRMEEEIARVEERRALQSIQRQRTLEQASTLLPVRPPAMHSPAVRTSRIDLESLPEEEKEEEEDAEENRYSQDYEEGGEGEGHGIDDY